jgi:hypothetical protein
MVRSFIATARAHVHNMTTNFGRTCMPWGPKRSLFAGGTGALFIVPGIVMYVHDPDAPHAVRYLAAFALQAVLSVMSDYVMTGRHSVWHGMDRWYASGMTVSLFAPPHIDPPVIVFSIESIKHHQSSSHQARHHPSQVFMIRFAHSALSPTHVLLAVPPLFCLYKAKDGILRNDFHCFATWHGWWHVLAVAAASHCVDLANGGGGLYTRAVTRLEL